MDSFYFNKIAGATLSCLLLIVGMRVLVDEFYPKGTANLSKGTIVVTTNPVPAEGAGSAKPQVAEAKAPAEAPVEKVLASANVGAGKTAAKQCATCHSWENGGKNAVGPNLFGVVGREIGKHAGFSYSQAVASHGGTWTFELLYNYLKSPKQTIPGNKMAFAGISNDQDRANIIAFLNTQSEKPLPLPK